MKTDLVIYKDRLSDLSDCVLLHILSNLKTKEAVQTCVLSTRWKNLWKSLTVFSLSSHHFKTSNGFTKFVTRYLAIRDDKIALHALNLYRDDFMKRRLLEKIFKYAVSHNVQQLDISVTCHIQQFPPCNFSCHTLTSLKLSVDCEAHHNIPIFPNSLKFPALTNLCLSYFSFRGTGDDGRVEPFSEFNNLNSLVLYICRVLDAENLFISSATLVNLRVEILRHFDYKLELSTPSLCSFAFNGNPLQKLCRSNSNLSSIKHVNIHVHDWSNVEYHPLVLLNWLVELALMESLTVSSNTLKLLSLVPDSLEVDFPFLCNLKSMNINTFRLSSIPSGIVDFFRKNASLVKVYTNIIQSPRDWMEDTNNNFGKRLEISMDGE